MIFFGCSQWGYSNWVGDIYPSKTKPADFLYHYARKFNCVEVNSTYHDYVEPSRIARWAGEVGKDFRFCPKFPKAITHDRFLRDAEVITDDFLYNLSFFKENLGIAFLQLPPRFMPHNLNVLDTYLRSLPKDFKVSVELKPNFIQDDKTRSEAFKILAQNNTGIVILDSKDTIKHMSKYKLTNHSAMIRFNCYGYDVDKPRIDNWIKMISKWNDKGLPEIYFFMHFPDSGTDLEILNYSIEEFGKLTGASQ